VQSGVQILLNIQNDENEQNLNPTLHIFAEIFEKSSTWHPTLDSFQTPFDSSQPLFEILRENRLTPTIYISFIIGFCIPDGFPKLFQIAKFLK
jgi:hypothetical protein